MLKQLFPKQVSNDYQGAKMAKWVFIIITVVTVARSLVHILLPDGGAGIIAGLPLETFTPNGRATVIQIFAQWGLAQLLFGLLYIFVLWRCQSLIPLMYLFIILEYTGRLLLGWAKPIETLHTVPGAVGNYIMIPLALVMLFISLKKRKSL